MARNMIDLVLMDYTLCGLSLTRGFLNSLCGHKLALKFEYFSRFILWNVQAISEELSGMKWEEQRNKMT